MGMQQTMEAWNGVCGLPPMEKKGIIHQGKEFMAPLFDGKRETKEDLAPAVTLLAG